MVSITTASIKMQFIQGMVYIYLSIMDTILLINISDCLSKTRHFRCLSSRLRLDFVSQKCKRASHHKLTWDDDDQCVDVVN